MSDAAVSGTWPARFRAQGQEAARPAEDTTKAETPAKHRFLRRLRTMGKVDLRGLEIDITPAEIMEDLDYGRD